VLASLVPPLRHVGVVAFWTVATGALHQDGLADTVDALAGVDHDDSLRIMRESTIGVVRRARDPCSPVAPKLAALAALGAGAGLVLAPAIGRSAMLLSALGASRAERRARSELVAALEPGPSPCGSLHRRGGARPLRRRGLLACLVARLLPEACAARRRALRGRHRRRDPARPAEIGETLALATPLLSRPPEGPSS